MAFVRLLQTLLKDESIGDRFVPIIPDEARTFGMDSLFPKSKIYSPAGMTYDAVDRDKLLSWQESTSGQMLHEGITEAGSMGSAIAAGSSYATHGEPMIPVYVFYSMFGFQHTGSLMWAMADQLARGFLIGATAGRTSLNGEGLQHQDGQSPLLASANPACVHYDPAFGFEIAHIVRDGLQRMYGSTEEHPAGEDVFYYITLYNDPYPQPPEPETDPGQLQRDILRGLYRYQDAPAAVEGSDDGGRARPGAQILASGVAMPWAVEAQRLLAEEWDVAADLWSATSWNELRRDALACDESNRLHPGEEQRVPHVSRALSERGGPVVAVSDFMRAVPDQIAPWVPEDYTPRWAPTASAARTLAPRCGATTASTRRASSWLCCRCWPHVTRSKRTPSSARSITTSWGTSTSPKHCDQEVCVLIIWPQVPGGQQQIRLQAGRAGVVEELFYRVAAPGAEADGNPSVVVEVFGRCAAAPSAVTGRQEVITLPALRTTSNPSVTPQGRQVQLSQVPDYPGGGPG